MTSPADSPPKPATADLRSAFVVDDAGSSNARNAALVFGVVAVLAVPFLLWAGREQWFFLDEWDFIDDRSLTDVESWFRPHNEHLVAVPVVLWRLIYGVVGLNSYVAYQLPVVVFHVLLVVVLRVVMRRCGVSSWVASAMCVPLLVLGSGYTNIIYGFQTTLTGSLLFGVVHMLLAVHDGPFARRDWIALAAGTVGLLCSGVSVFLTAGVGLAVLLRRGWRPALFHTAPLAMLYVAWLVGFGRDGFVTERATPGQTIDFVQSALRYALSSVTQYRMVAVLLVVVLFAGAVVLAIDRAGVGRKLAMPVGLVAACLIFLTATAVGRAAGSPDAAARQIRYVHVVVALCLPLAGVLVQTLVDRWRFALPVALAAMWIGVPGNIDTMANREGLNRFDLGTPRAVLTLAHSAELDGAPGDLRPFPQFLPADGDVDLSDEFVGRQRITVDFLREGVADGDIPRHAADESDRLAAKLAVGVDTELEMPEGTVVVGGPCGAATGPIDLVLRSGEAVRYEGPFIDVRLVVDGVAAGNKRFFARYGHWLYAVSGPITVRIPAAPQEVNALCVEPAG